MGPSQRELPSSYTPQYPLRYYPPHRDETQETVQTVAWLLLAKEWADCTTIFWKNAAQHPPYMQSTRAVASPPFPMPRSTLKDSINVEERRMAHVLKKSVL